VVLARIPAVDRDAVIACARRLLSAPPTVAAIGPLGHLEPYARIAERLAR
jgi:predicted Zn-dependent peptidase